MWCFNAAAYDGLGMSLESLGSIPPRRRKQGRPLETYCDGRAKRDSHDRLRRTYPVRSRSLAPYVPSGMKKKGSVVAFNYLESWCLTSVWLTYQKHGCCRCFRCYVARTVGQGTKGKLAADYNTNIIEIVAIIKQDHKMLTLAGLTEIRRHRKTAGKHGSINRVKEQRIHFDVRGPFSAGCVDHFQAVDDRRPYSSDQCIRLFSLFKLLPTPMNFHSLKLSEASVITFYPLWPDRFQAAHFCKVWVKAVATSIHLAT